MNDPIYRFTRFNPRNHEIPVLSPSASVPRQHQLFFASFRLLLPFDEPSQRDNHHPVLLYPLLDCLLQQYDSADLVFNMKWFRRISARLPLIQEERNDDPEFSGSDDESGLDQEESPVDDHDPDAGTSRCQKRKLGDDDFMSDRRAEIVYNSSGACPDIAVSLSSIHHMYRSLKVTTVQA